MCPFLWKHMLCARRSLVLALAGLLVATSSARAQVDSFRPIGRFLVPDGGVAEVVSATPDGNTVVYSNSVGGSVGVVDITDPRDPVLMHNLPVDGEPTSVSVTPDGSMLLVVVNTSTLSEGERPRFRPGRLHAFRLSDAEPLGSLRLDYGPDSIKTAEIGGEMVAVVALENESIVVDDEFNVGDDPDPGDPGIIAKRGFVTVVTIDPGDFPKSTVRNVFMPRAAELEAAGLLFGHDPQPEYVDINGTIAAVTLQENNGVVLIDLSDPGAPVVVDVWELGVVGDQPADLIEDEVISLTDVYPADLDDELAGRRFPDALAWNAAGSVIVTADEGEFNDTGGRGFSCWSADGQLVWSDGGLVEQLAVLHGQYPEGRSENKGVEMEGVDTGVFGDKEFAFVCSERGSFVIVTDITDASNAQIIQLLPTGIAPETVLALPQRNLVMTSDEGDDESGTISFFEGVAGLYEPDPDRPSIRTAGATPDHGFGALSGMTGDLADPNLLYAVPDDAIKSTIYTITVGGPIAQLSVLAPVTEEVIDEETGESVQVQSTFDLEGIAVDTSIAAPAANPGFWLSSEGNADFGDDGYRPNLLIQVDGSGKVLQTVKLPEEIDPDVPPPVEPPEGEEPVEPEPIDPVGKIRSSGFEGNTISADGEHLLCAIQRQFLGEVAVDGVLHTRIGRYSLATQSWEFFLYPLEDPQNADTWAGLSEITQLGDDTFAVIERDGKFGGLARLKRVYTFSLDGVEPFEGVLLPENIEGIDLTGKVIQKTLLYDVLEDFVPFEKVEGLALTTESDLWCVLDNDGGGFESRFVRLGRLGE